MMINELYCANNAEVFKMFCIFESFMQSSTEHLLRAIHALLQSARTHFLRQTFACFEAACVLK